MGKESMLEDDDEIELDDLENTKDDEENDAENEPGIEQDPSLEVDEDGNYELENLDDRAGGNGVPETETDRPHDAGEPETGTETEDTESEEPAMDPDQSAVSRTMSELYEKGAAKGSALVEKLKGKTEELMDVALPKAEGLIDKHKGKFFNAYDTVMDLKDEMHYASKNSGGGFKGLKSAAGVLGKHIRETDAYKQFMDSAVGQGIQAAGRGISWTKDKIKSGAAWAGNKIKSGASWAGDKIKSGAAWAGNKIKGGASWAADKFNGTKLGKWIQEKRANQSDEPGFFSKAWDKVKTGAGAAAEKVKSGASWVGNKVKSGASWAADKFNGTKLGKWIQEKRANQSDEPGFFGKAWNAVKTGAGTLAENVKGAAHRAGDAIKGGISWAGNHIKSGASSAGNAIKNGASWLGKVVKNGASLAVDKFKGTKLGKWVQEKFASDPDDEPGALSKAWDKVKTGSKKLLNKAKRGLTWAGEQKDRAGKWIGEQKEWAGQKMSDLRLWKHIHIDEPLDNHEHERRVRFMERQGDTGYGQRYNTMVEKLKELPGIERLKGLAEGGELEEVLLELEKGEDSVSEKAESAVGKAGAVAGKGSGLLSAPSSILDVKFIKNGLRGSYGGIVDQISDGLSYGKAGLHALKDGAGIATAQILKRDLSKMEKKTSDPTLKKGINFAKKNADKTTVHNSFDIAKTGVTAAGRALKQKTAAKIVNKTLDLAESAVTSHMDKGTRKESLKGLLGGVEGYRKLKEQYKLRAPEMRRAIRQAIGVSSEEDVTNMDRFTTSHDIMKNARDGDQDSRDFAKRMKTSGSRALYKAMGGGDVMYRTQHYAAQEG